MKVEELLEYLKHNWEQLKSEILSSSYRPKPVKRVEIPKPDGGVRKLGIPTVVDRLIQQSLLQVLQPKYDPTFSPHSFGFRPGKSAHQAVKQAQEYIQEGYAWIVDLDLEKFFDRVNHDKLMARMAKDIRDKRVLRLIRKFLQSGIMENGLVSPGREGTPQGGPLSPLLSNIVLDELDVELTKRKHRFVRYADDQNIYVKSETAAKRVFATITKFITHKLKLKVNECKSAVARPWNRKILGFSFTSKDKRRKVAPKAIERFKDKIRLITRRTGGRSLIQVTKQLKVFVNGWKGYFGFAEVRSDFKKLDSWIRRKLRCLIWKQWQNSGTRYRELRKRGVKTYPAWVTIKSGRGPWGLCNSPAVLTALDNKFFEKLEIPKLDMVPSQM
jgi:RNA-directed DNA polymerase